MVLTTYPLIARDREVLLSRDWHMAVLDEAQTVKNPNAATTRWLRDVKARHRFCLTGTPMENHLGELWSIMSFANPGFLGDKAAFSRLWRLPIEKRADKERATALARRVKPFLLRRTKAEVATELPAEERDRRAHRTGGQPARPLRFDPPVDVGQGSQGDRAARPGQEPHHRARSAAQDAAGLLRSVAPETR